MNRRIATTLVSLSLAAAASLALADHPSPAPGGAPEQQGWSKHHDKSDTRLPSERVEPRLAYIKTALKITDAQKPQWEAFADAQRKQAQAEDKQMKEWQAKREQRHEADAPGPAGEQKHSRPSAVDRIEHEKEFLSTALTRLDAKLAAIKPLYAVLSDEQKRVADEVLVDRPHGRKGHHKPA